MLQSLSNRRVDHCRGFAEGLPSSDRTSGLLPPSRLASHGRCFRSATNISQLRVKTNRYQNSLIPYFINLLNTQWFCCFLFLWLHFVFHVFNTLILFVLVLLIVFLIQSGFRVFVMACFNPTYYLLYVFNCAILYYCSSSLFVCHLSCIRVCFLISFNNNYNVFYYLIDLISSLRSRFFLFIHKTPPQMYWLSGRL